MGVNMLAFKQLTKQVFKNRVFIFLLMLLMILGSLSFFFVRFSIDGNQNQLDVIMANGGDIEKYKTGTQSNITLAYAFLIATGVLTSFVFFIFYYRFFRKEQKQFGCLKSLGFKDDFLRSYFVMFTAIFAIISSLLGVIIAYPLSNVLIQANVDTYNVSGLIKSVNISTVLLYFIVTTLCFSLVAFLSYCLIKGKETGTLLAGAQDESSNSTSFKIANKISSAMPLKNKFSLRLALRKPITVLLILIAVMSFSTCMILAYSLNGSSEKVFISQTKGHNYEYMTTYNQPISDTNQDDTAIPILTSKSTIFIKNQEIDYNINGLYKLTQLYELENSNHEHNLLTVPSKGTVIIGEELQKVYSIEVGDLLHAKIGNQFVDLLVTDIASNAQSRVIYMNGDELATLLNVPQGNYNVLLTNNVSSAGETTTSMQRINELKRDAVSNQLSGIINQVIGVVVGCILLFLALYMSFQSNTRDMLIMHMLGYQPKAIRNMFINIYRPLVLFFFVLTLLPSIWIVQTIQKNLSIATGDYMPFSANFGIVLLIFFILLLIYQLVQWIFNFMLKRIIRKTQIFEYISNE